MSVSESKSAVVLELAEEFLERYRQGQRPSLKEYIDRHPELAGEIKEVFPAMALMENIALADESLGEVANGSASTPRETPPEQLGDYRILREVGRGGMGIVYEAEQVSLGRHVALKVLPRKVLLDAAQKRRFEREAKSAAKLHHTNIVPVFGVGEHDGLPYYVMQFIQGLGLDQVLHELKRLHKGTAPDIAEPRVARVDVSAMDMARSLLTGAFQASPKRQGEVENAGDGSRSGEPSRTHGAARLVALTSDTVKLSDSSSLNLPGVAGKGKKATCWQSMARIGVQVADALEYAHKQGIQHRDIKPSNLLLDTAGTVWVADFGLARADNEDHLTQTGDIVGTLRYLPPEAFEGRSDRRSDLYSLGLTLYELLALRPAFEERDRHKLIKQVTTAEPARLDKLNRAIPRDLVMIVHKSIDREPGRRYQTAGELAADLQRFLDDEPIQARRISNGERLLRCGRRNKGLAVLSALSLLLLVTVALVSTLSALRLLAEQKRANRAERDTLAVNVKSLLTASPDSMPFLVDTFRLRTHEVLPALGEREREMAQEFVPRLRVNVALAVLGQDRCRELCDATEDTPSAESFNLLLGLKSGDRETIVMELSRRYSQAKDGEGRTRLAIALLELGDPRAAQTELALKPNLTARTRFIHRFATWHGDLAAVVDLLRSLEDTAFRSGLCLAVASVEPTRLSPLTLRALDDVLTYLYSSAPDSGIHGASEYDLRHRGLPLPAIAPTQGPIIGRRWFVNRQGMTLLAVGPGWFHPLDYARPPGSDGLPAQTVVQTRTLFMGDREVTAEWYRRFLKSTDHPKGEEIADAIEQADHQHGLARVKRRAAVLFCNWLSRAEGRTPCYRPSGPELGMMCDFTANGYRLPTDAEWEHAFRCGTTTRFFVGDDVSRMREYGRVFTIEPGPGEFFFPNSHGLFDMLGNDWEMCWDQRIDQYGTGLSINPVGPVGRRFAMRGGAAEAGLFYLHGSARPVNDANVITAFRIVCASLNAEDAKDDKIATLSALNRFLEPYAKSSPQLWTQRGRLYAEMGQDDEAIAAFAKAVQLKPDDPQVWKERGRFYFELGQTDKATADFRKTVELLGDKALPSQPTASEADKLFARLADDALLKPLTAAIERNPEDMARRWQRGDWHARHGRWKEASADYVLALECKPPAETLHWLYAVPALAAGDRESYRRQRREMLKRFGETQDPTTAERIAKACLLLSEAGKETDLVCRLADRAVTWGKNYDYAYYFIFCKGLADYRQGNFAAAMEELDPLVPGIASRTDLTTHCHLVLAMAHQRQGEAKAARKHLAEATKLLKQNVHDLDHIYMEGSQYGHDRLIAWLLHREAQTLIEGKNTETKK